MPLGPRSMLWKPSTPPSCDRILRRFAYPTKAADRRLFWREAYLCSRTKFGDPEVTF